MKPLLELIKANRAGKGVGIYAVCSAHPEVLRAALQQAKADQSLLLIEATANQVNQDGGYTGMQPADFIQYVQELALEQQFPVERVLFGGDHLGPVCWQHLNSAMAMHKAQQLIRSFVAAGFQKIHLDTSMGCTDDPTPLPDKLIAERAAVLCQAAEQTAQACFGRSELCYVIGTEVPPPGGVATLDHCLAPTPVAQVAQTLTDHQQAFSAIGLTAEVWQRVIAVVVQPGVEFDNLAVHVHQQQQSQALAAFIQTQPQLVYEAHSTDYQPISAYPALLKQHFAILKVGPQLTFALREAYFSLSYIENQLLPVERRSHLIAVCERVMQQQPDYWQKFYQGQPQQLSLYRQFSFSDRIRYYWQQPEIQAAVQTLLLNLQQPMPLPLLSQFLPAQYEAVLNGTLANQPEAILQHKIAQVLARYASACLAA